LLSITKIKKDNL